MKRKACAECKHNCKEDFKGVCLKCLNDGGKEFEGKPTDAVRLIDVNSITEAMVVKYLGSGYASCAPDVLDLISDMHTIEAEPVVHAHWVGHAEDDSFVLPGEYRCSACGEKALYDSFNDSIVLSHRCPNCGAYMDGGKNHETD